MTNNRNGYTNEYNGFIYNSEGEVILATVMNENGRPFTYYIRENTMCDLINVNDKDSLIEMLMESSIGFSVNVFNRELVNEATAIRLPLDADRDLKNMGHKERDEVIDRIPHVKLWIAPYNLPADYSKYARCWVWVELPKAQDGVKYVPIILHTTGGVSVHPYYHKYFLRAFNKHDRHLILGFLYVYDYTIVAACHYAQGKDEIPDTDVFEIERFAFRYTDDMAPKRINAGPKDTNSEFFKNSIKDYKRWTKNLKNKK